MSKQTKLVKEGWINVICKVCNMRTVRVPESTLRVTCPYCVQERVGMPETPGYVSTGRPRGWHFKKYFEFEDKVYSRGKEVKDPEKIKKLKKQFKQR